MKSNIIVFIDFFKELADSYLEFFEFEISEFLYQKLSHKLVCAIVQFKNYFLIRLLNCSLITLFLIRLLNYSLITVLFNQIIN